MGGRDSRSTTLRLLLLAGLVVASQSASLTRIQSAEFGPLPQSAVCPQTCTLVNKQIQYTPGSTYLYKVQLSTRIGDQSQNQAPTSSEDDQTPSFENQEVVITAQAEISAYSQCELVMRLRKVQVAGFEDGRSQRLASQLQAAPIHFAYEDGIVADVCADQTDDQWIIDVKKSVISALQMSSSDVAQPQNLIETDISGRCETVYEPLESNSEVTILRKTKSRSKCSDRHQVNIAFFPAAYGLNQALQNSLSSVLTPNSTSECTQVLKGQIIESVACEDRQELRYPLNGLPITSRIELQLTEKRAEIAVQRIETPFVRTHRSTSSSPFTSTASSKVNSIFSSTVAESQRRAYSIGEVAHLLKNICRKVHYSVEYDVPVLFHELITSLHFLPAADQAQLWSQIHAGSICPSPKLRDIFLDAAALSGSEGSIEVLLQAYQSQHVISRARANYLFGLLAFSKAPTVAAARRLVTFIQQQQQQQNQQLVQLPRGVLFGATGFVHNLQMTAEGQSTQAHQLVQDLVHSLIQAIKVVIPQAMASQPEHQQALTLIYSLKNLVLVDQVFQPTAHQLVELLKQVVSSSSPAPHTIEISVAIVRTLVNAGIDDSVRQYLLQSILINPQDSIHHVELQIEAYRAIVLSGATQSQLETIKQWTERISSSSSSRRNGPQQQLVNYIRSHQANLRSTSDPHKQTILPAGAPIFEAPSGAWFGVSRNYEFSYVDHEIGVGFSLEGDVIYEASTTQSSQQLFPVPQTVAFNYTMPIGGQELQLVEVRFHQHGLEPLIERHMRAMDRQFRSADPAKVALETLKYLLIHGTEIFAENPHIRVLLQIVVDGKTVVLADERDITSEDIAIAELDFLGQLTEQLHSSIAIDRAFAITPVDSLVRFPSVNGLPVTVRLNSSVVFGFKSEVAVDVRNADDTRISFAVYPSVAVTAETAVAFHAGSEKKVVEHVQSWSSAPQLNFEARGSRGRIVTFKVDLPQKKYTLARIESVIYSRNVATGERVRLMVPKSSSQIVGSYPTSDIHICSKATEKALGVAICYDLSYNTNLPYGRDFDLLAEITVVKTDSGLTSYEATFESPLKFSQIFSQKSQLRSAKDIIDELAPFRFHFNTPGSEVDRHIQLELELVNSHSALVKEARLRLKTPWKAVTGALVLRNEAKERVAKIELTVDGQPKWLAAEVALEVVRRGAKTEWKPRVILSMNSILERPVHLAGALSISRGRKTSIHLQLEDSIARRQYIKGTYIRERPSERNALARTSADLVVALRGLQAKSAATFEHGDRLVKIEISSDYKLPSWDRTEQAKVALKLQNHSNNSGEKKVTKMTGIGLIKATQLSKYEINYSQNLHIISGESLEHDLKLDWASDSDSSSSSSSSPQVRLHQTAKKTGQRGKVDLEASSLVIYRPQQVHYEVKVTGGAVVSPLLSYHLAAVGTGKHSSQFNFKGDVAYALLSKSPLKLDMSISLKAPQVGLVYVYHDEIEEKSPGEYHGHLLLQTSPVDQYDISYVYRLSEDESQRAMEHRMDVIFLKGSMKKLAYKHHGLLRLEDGGKAISLRSRLTDEQAAKGANEIWNTQIDLAPGKKEITFSSLPKEIRAKAKYEAVYQGPSSAQWSFDSPALTHQAEYEYSGPEGQYWSFDSKTKRAGEKLMEIQSKANAKLGHRRLRLSSKYFDGECELELPSESQQKKAKLRFDLPNSWSHESTFSQAPEQQSSVMQVDSRTHYAQNSVPIYDLSARYDPSTSQSQFKLNTPLNSVEMQAEMSQAKKIALKKALLKFKRGSDYEHQSQFNFEPSTSAVDFDSLTTGKSGSPLTKLKYAYAGHRDQLHQIDLQTPEEISLIGGQWSGQWDGQRRSAKIDWANKRANLKHNTQITVDQPDQIMVSFDSTTSDYQSGSPLFQAKGALNPSDRSWISLKSHKKDQLRKMDFEAHRSKRSAKLDFDYDQYTHQSEINAGDEQEQDQQWKAKCNTRKSGKTIFDLDARIGGIKGANKFDASIPNYDFSSMLDLPSQIASMDLKSRRSGRHLLGSVGVNQQADADRSFHFDFAWDIDRDPASKVALDLLIKRVPIESRSRSAGQQLMIEASAAYAESKLIFNSQFVPKSGGFSSPHPIRLSLSFIPSSSSSSSNSQRDSWQLIYLHQMEQPNSFTCKWEWIVGGRPQYGLQLNGKLENESFGNSAKKIIFSAKTSAPASKPRLALTFNLVAGVRAPGNAYFFDSSLVHGNDQTFQKKYQATFDLTKHLETRKVDGKLEIRLPALKVHVAAFSLDLTERRFSLELINEQSGKMVDIEASYGHHLVHLKVASQGAQSLLVPKVDALVRYVPGEELHARLSLDEERKFELTAKYSGELSKLQFYVLTKVDSVYTPSVEFTAEGRKPSEESGSAQRSVAITGKWNMVEVVKAGFNQAAVRQWTAQGFVASVGSGDKLVEASVVSTPTEEHFTTYQVKVQPKEGNAYGMKAFGAKIEERRPTAANEYIRSVKVDIYQQQQEQQEKRIQILSTEVSLKHAKWAQIPEMVEVSLRHVPSASHGSLRVAIREKVSAEDSDSQNSLFSTVPETASVSGQKRSSVLRDQMLLGWNTKSVGFALITSQWTSPSQATEHALKIYTPSGRVVEHRCAHLWSEQLVFFKQALKADYQKAESQESQEQPLYQTTVIVQRNQNQEAGQGYKGKLLVESFKFARSPKAVHFEVQPASQERPLEAKLRIDIGASEKEALTLKMIVENKPAAVSAGNRYFGLASVLNQTVHFEAKSEKSVDFSVDGHVSQSSVGMLWKNVNRKGKLQQGHYLLQFIGDDRFEAVLSNPTTQYLINGIYKRKQTQNQESPLVMDLTVQKSVSKHSNSYSSSAKSNQLVSEHKVHIESAGRCIRAEIEDVQKLTSSRQINLCADLQRANILNLAVDSIGANGQKTAEFSARLDAKSAAKSLALGASWNPVYSRRLLQTLLNIKEASGSEGSDLVNQISHHELVQELSAKYDSLFRSVLANAAQPLAEVAKELAPIAAEYGITEAVLQRWASTLWTPVSNSFSSISQTAQENLDQLTSAYEETVEEVKKACARSSGCRSISEALAKGNDEIARLASKSMVNLLKKTHRFVVRSKGALLEKMNAQQWAEQLTDLVPETVSETLKSSIESAYSWTRSTVLNPSGPFSGVIRHLETIFGELMGSGDQSSIKWQRIESSISEAVHLLASPSAWASSVRVLLWDPTNGQLMVEVKSPQSAFTSAFGGLDSSDNSNSSASSYSWLNGINSYDRAAQPTKAASSRFY